MTEHPHPPNMPGSSNAFHPHGSYPWGTTNSPWMHYHHAYNTHWRGCGRARGRLLFFMLGAGAATLFFKWKRHGDEWSGGNYEKYRQREGVRVIGYPDSSRPTADAARAMTSNRAEDERPKWTRNRIPGSPVPDVPASQETSPANGHVDQSNTYNWKWDQDAMVKSATGTVSSCPPFPFVSFDIFLSTLTLKLEPRSPT